MELITLQRLFYDALFEKKTASFEKVCKHIKAADHLTPVQGLAIYRESVIGRLHRTLIAIYPVCYRLVGRRFFEATAETYIHRFCSISPDLGDYGEQFPDFLTHFEPAMKLPYLPDVARLEWHWHRVFNGEDATPLDLSSLADIPQEKWDNLIFHLPKNSVLLESIYPVYRIWQVNQSDYQGDDRIDLDEGTSRIFLWRQGYDMHLDLPTDDEWQLLKAFRARKRLETICEELAIDVPFLLTQFVQRKWVTRFSITQVSALKKESN